MNTVMEMNVLMEDVETETSMETEALMAMDEMEISMETLTLMKTETLMEMDFFPKIISPSAGENSGDLA